MVHDSSQGCLSEYRADQQGSVQGPSPISPSGVDTPETRTEMVPFLVTEFHEPHIRELGSF